MFIHRLILYLSFLSCRGDTVQVLVLILTTSHATLQDFIEPENWMQNCQDFNPVHYFVWPLDFSKFQNVLRKIGHENRTVLQGLIIITIRERLWKKLSGARPPSRGLESDTAGLRSLRLASRLKPWLRTTDGLGRLMAAIAVAYRCKPKN